MKYKEQIKCIMQDFNFVGLNKAMTAMNIGWSYESGNQIPSVSDLKSIAERCLNNAAYSKNESSEYAIGGFEATKINNVLELRFVIERVSTLKFLLNPDVNEKDKLAGKA